MQATLFSGRIYDHLEPPSARPRVDLLLPLA
jgi:hypothetical protein